MNAPHYMAVRLHLNNLTDPREEQFADSSRAVRGAEVCLGPGAAELSGEQAAGEPLTVAKDSHSPGPCIPS